MKYQSTRGGETNLSFENVLFAGYAKDNGVYMPQQIPTITPDELDNWATLSYPQIMVEVMKKYIDEDEIIHQDLKDIVDSALQNFKIPEIVRVKQLDKSLNIIELFHGTTMAFKDLALSVVGALIQYFLKKKEKKVIILVGTSGDTGSAAIHSVRSRDNIDIIVLLPKGRCTQIQELQMTTVLDDNVHVYSVDGTSDDLDIPIKQCFGDTKFAASHNLVSINSINWGRILAQITHYVYAYLQLCSSVGEPVEIIVPTGAAGNITAGALAQKMGLPITVVAAVNENDIVARTLKSGDFSARGKVIPSYSSAMDIQMPYNMERLFFLFSNKDTDTVNKLMKEFEDAGGVRIPDNILTAIKTVITDSIVTSDNEAIEVMKKIQERYDYILCPHTAVAVRYHYTRPVGNIARGYVATASPAKFPEAVRKAGCVPVIEGVSHLQTLPTKCIHLEKSEDWLSILREKIIKISAM